MKLIGKNGHPNINECLGAYIQAEEKRLLNKPYSAGFIFDDDYCYDDEYGDLNFMFYDDESSQLRHLASGLDDTFDAEYYACHRLDKKNIYFYPNIYDEDVRKKFNNLHEFNEFCNEKNYFMTDKTVMELMKRNTSHCCLDPDDLRCGDYVIVADNSYGALLYSVCDYLD